MFLLLGEDLEQPVATFPGLLALALDRFLEVEETLAEHTLDKSLVGPFIWLFLLVQQFL